jgi:hypothetical protein
VSDKVPAVRKPDIAASLNERGVLKRACRGRRHAIQVTRLEAAGGGDAPTQTQDRCATGVEIEMKTALD